MRQPDIIRDVIRRMMAHEASITEELALVVERECRAEWGGQRIEYVPRTVDLVRGRPPAPADAQQAAYIEALNGAPTDEITRRHGISRATLYRLIKRGPPGSA